MTGVLFAVLLGCTFVLAPAPASAHTAGSIDPHGCHPDNRKDHDYHCHRGRYSGLRFRSKSEMIRNKKAGLTAEAIRLGRAGESLPTTADEQDSDDADSDWSLLDLGKKDDGKPARAAAPAEQAASSGKPRRGLDDRLRTLRDLHTEGLITDDEYEQKKAELLAEL